MDPNIPLLTLPPEIQRITFGYLSQQDLTSCARVNTLFNTIFTPTVWETIHIRTTAQLERFKTTEAQEALIRHAVHVRELHLVHKGLFSIFIPPSPMTPLDLWFMPSSYSTGIIGPPPRWVPCTNLKRLIVCCCDTMEEYLVEAHIIGPTPSSREMEADLLALVRQNPTLKAVKIRNNVSTFTATRLALEFSSTISELLLTTTISPNATRTLLNYLPRHFTKLRLRTVDRGYETLSETPILSGPGPADHEALTSLHIHGDLSGLEEHILLPFLNTCGPNLKNFQGYGIGWFRNQRVIKVMMQRGIYLSRLGVDDLPDNTLSSDDQIANIINFNPRLKEIDLRGCLFAGQDTVAAILDHCEQLETLRLHGCSGITGLDLHDILGHTSSLKHLQTIDEKKEAPDDFEPPSLADQGMGIFEQKWATSSLESFQCIVRVERINSQVPMVHVCNIWNSPTIEECHAAQRCFHAQLAKQTSLHTLRLGDIQQQDEDKPFNRPEMVWYSLEMTLESGLDLLCGLKQMRVLDVRMMNHRMGARELDWIKDHWPRLRYIDGLFEGDKAAAQEAKGWLNVNRPNWICS